MSEAMNTSFIQIRWYTVLFLLGLLIGAVGLSGVVWAQAATETGEGEDSWIEEIEKIFIPSEQCKQCHDRHYEEWKGMREQTMDLKTFGRVDGALLHGTALTSPVFRTVLGLWLQTKPDSEQRTRCLSCHVPSGYVLMPSPSNPRLERRSPGAGVPKNTGRRSFSEIFSPAPTPSR